MKQKTNMKMNYKSRISSRSNNVTWGFITLLSGKQKMRADSVHLDIHKIKLKFWQCNTYYAYTLYCTVCIYLFIQQWNFDVTSFYRIVLNHFAQYIQNHWWRYSRHCFCCSWSSSNWQCEPMIKFLQFAIFLSEKKTFLIFFKT